MCSGRGGVDNRKPGQAPLLEAAPVTYRLTGEGSSQAQWVPIAQAQIKELCKAQREFSRESEYFRGLLRSVLAQGDLVPADLWALFSSLLSPMEFRVWAAEWGREVGEVLSMLWGSPSTSHDAEGTVLGIDHLIGTGVWASGATQARVLFPNQLLESCRAAERAFYKLPAATSQVEAEEVRQGPQEPYLAFVERLHRFVSAQVPGGREREELLRQMAYLNDNSACKEAIRSLPLSPRPTVEQMIEVCARKVPLQDPQYRQKRVSVAFAEFPAKECSDAEAATASAPSTPGTGRRTTATHPCHLCGQMGHWMPQCPLRWKFLEFRNKEEEKGEGD
ncbi:endogenous retrovirus group K member 6 Gag polyprotein-like [Geothlypis trichas]